MDLKNIILSTLSEIENKDESKIDIKREKENSFEEKEVIPIPKQSVFVGNSDEEEFLNSLRERILVLFEGFQAPNNQNLETKMDLTLNFLEYLLAAIDERLQKIDQKP